MQKGNISIPGQNNFDIIRVIFSINVLLYHAYFLSGIERLKYLHFDVGTSVTGFFIISGFLIFMSFEKSKSLKDFFMKRVRRIYPAYICVIILSASVLAFLTEETIWNYVTSWGLYKYLVSNLIFANFLAPCLPGVFTGNRMCAVNGALWTMKVEVMFYLSIPIIVWLFRKFNKLIIFGILYTLSCLYVYYFQRINLNAELSRQLPGQMAFFISGGFLYYYFGYFKRYKHTYGLIAAILFLLSFFADIWYMVPISLSALIIYCAFHLPATMNIGKIGDISYGIYIFHFPIIQALTQMGVFKSSPYAALFITLLLTLVMSLLSWHLVEKKFLRRGSHYIKAS